jgi:hypothetical protein
VSVVDASEPKGVRTDEDDDLENDQEGGDHSPEDASGLVRDGAPSIGKYAQWIIFGKTFDQTHSM